MARELRLNAFDMNCVGHIQHGLWTHPRDRSTEYTSLAYWAELARIAERGLLDGVFLADIVGVYDVHGGSADAAIAHAVQLPVGDPMLLVPGMAQVTTHLGFGVTCNLTYEPPYLFARRMSTLDHLTGGRLGWNVVTGYLDSAARAMGLDRQPAHDARYDTADEYMQLVYRLWEHSWEDGAVLRDRTHGVYADPARVHRVRHDGAHFRMDAIHLCEPSPQRTPVLYQAGASERGRRFAATHAECVFLAAPTPEATRRAADALRAEAVACGRAPRDLALFSLASVVVGRTPAEARDRLAEYSRHASTEAALAHYSASLGIDLSRFAPHEPIRHQRTDANHSALDLITRDAAGEPWTVARLTRQMVLGSRSQPIVGSGAQVAEALIAWAEAADVDGFNLSRSVMPESLSDFVELVVPELQARGAYKLAYAPGTLREKLFGREPRLPASHPARKQGSAFFL